MARKRYLGGARDFRSRLSNRDTKGNKFPRLAHWSGLVLRRLLSAPIRLEAAVPPNGKDGVSERRRRKTTN